MGKKKLSYSKLQIIRDYYHLSELKLASEVHCDVDDIVAIESGKNISKNDEIAIKLAEFFLCYPDSIVERTGEKGKAILLDKLPKRDTLKSLLLKKKKIDVLSYGGCQKADELFGFSNEFTAKTIRLKHPLSGSEIGLICEKLGVSAVAFETPEQLEIPEQFQEAYEIATDLIKKQEPLSADVIENGVNVPTQINTDMMIVGLPAFVYLAGIDKEQCERFNAICNALGIAPAKAVADLIKGRIATAEALFIHPEDV